VLYNAFSRSPEIDCDLFDFRNNILYNVRSGHSKRLTNQFNLIANLVIANPNTDIRYSFRSTDNNYVADNLRIDGDQVSEFVLGQSTYLTAPYRVAPVRTDAAADLEEIILPTVGASQPMRDATDAHWIEGLRSRTGKPVFWKDRVGRWESYNPGSNELANYEVLNLADFPAPVAAGAPPVVDRDADGMPDEWELSHELAPNDPADGPQDADADGYTNLEEFLNHTDPHQYVDYRQPENNVDQIYR
jgi:hypothetical protein